MGKIEELEKYVESLQPIDTWGCGIKRDRVWANKSSLLHFVDKIKEQMPTQPELVEVPEFVAEWIKNNNLSIRSVFWQLENSEIVNLDVAEWIDKNESLFVSAVINGYTVKKEQLYYVKFPNIETNGYDSWLMKMGDGAFELADNNDFESMQFTEKEIKAIDERYWAFAVPVEEEE